MSQPVRMPDQPLTDTEVDGVWAYFSDCTTKGGCQPVATGPRWGTDATEQEIALDSDEPPQRVRCNLKQFQFSAHASRESLIAYAKKVAPKKIVLVHGDPPAVDWVRAKLLAELPGIEVIVPTPGMELEL